MTLWRGSGIQLAYGARTIFDSLELVLEEGECVGLVGVNGSGKSTLLKIAAGLSKPDAGLIEQRRGAVVGYLPQEPRFPEGATVASELFRAQGRLAEAHEEHASISRALESSSPDAHEGLLRRLEEASAKIERLGGWDTTHLARSMLQRLGIPESEWERPLAQLSGGSQKRVAIAQVLLLKPDLLILDEPTNHLDVETIDWLETELDAFEGAILLVTHDRYFLDRLAERIVELEHGRLVGYPGNFGDYLGQKLIREEESARKEHKRQRLIAQELAWLRRGPEARRTKRKSRVDAARKLIAQKAPEVQQSATFRVVAPVRSGHTMFEMRHVSKQFGARKIVEDLSLILCPGERLGVVGRNGVGKTTFIRMLLGEEPASGGEVLVSKNTRLGYFDQTRANLDPEETVYDAAAEGDVVTMGDQKVHKRDYLGDLLFPVPMQKMKVGALSGGEKNRLLLARLLLSGANLLVLDEPTNDLDIVTLELLEDVLLDFNGSVVIVSHDRYFLDKVATSLLAFEGDGRAVLYAGNYEMYARLRGQTGSAAQPAPDKKKGAAAAPPSPQKPPSLQKGETSGAKPLTYKERVLLEQMEGLIEKAEAEKARIEAELADPELYRSRAGDVDGLKQSLERAAAEVERLFEQWQELESRNLPSA